MLQNQPILETIRIGCKKFKDQILEAAEVHFVVVEDEAIVVAENEAIVVVENEAIVVAENEAIVVVENEAIVVVENETIVVVENEAFAGRPFPFFFFKRFPNHNHAELFSVRPSVREFSADRRRSR